MKKQSLIFISILLTTFAAYGSGCFGIKSKIQDSTKEYLENHFFNGVYAIAVSDSKSSKTIESGAKGFVSFYNHKKLSPTQVMPIASATKTMTAAAVLKLRDKKLLNVQDPISKYLKQDNRIWDGNMPDWANKITIHNLLTHRSGLSEYFMASKIDVRKSDYEIIKGILSFASKKDLSFTPGEKYNYCNTNFIILGVIIENISGKKLADFFKDQLFKPLGMKNTRVLSIDEGIYSQMLPERSSFPIRYFVTPTGFEPKITQAKSDFIMITFSDGGVVSTVKDLMLWNRGLHNGKVLSKSSYKLMTQKHYELDEYKNKDLIRKQYVGYGIYISELNNGDLMYDHPGKALAIRSESGYLPKHNLSFAVLSNVMEYIPQEYKGKIDTTNNKNQLDIRYFVSNMLRALNR